MKSPLWSKPSLLRDFAVLSALIVFVLMLVSLWVTYVTYLDRSRYTLRQLESEATRIDRLMIIKIEHSSYLLESLGRQIVQMDTKDLAGIARLLRSFDTNVTLHNVFSWIDEKTFNVVSSNTGVHPPVDVSDREFVKRAVAEPWKVQIGSPIQGRVSKKWVLPVALGVSDSTGKFLGIILISMDIETIKRDLEGTIKDSGIAFAIYSNNMLLTEARPEGNSALSGAFHEKLKSIDFNKHSSGAVQTGNLFDDFTTHVYYEMSAKYPYTIVLGLDNSANTSSVRDLLVPRLLQIFLLGMFMLTLLWIVRLHVIKPVTELSHIAAGVVRGQPYRLLSSGGAGEVVVLAQEIKYLADYLEEMRRIEEEKDNKNLLLHKSKENAERSNIIKTEFLTAMSHGLRTPLNTIIGFSEIIKNQLYGPMENTQYWQYAQDIHQSAQHLQALIDDVLALSNAETSIGEWQEKSVDVRVVLGKCLRLVTERLQEKKLQVDIKSPEALPHLRIDETRFKQILINLFLHACQSTEKSNVLVEAYIEKGRSGAESFCISFTSYVPSIPPAANSTKTLAQDPTNLGLPLTKALVAMHQATLDITKTPGKSSTVTVRFPQERIVY
jgi:signal transduction histidine kinase